MAKSADAFRTISEVADWLGIPAHVLRFWESKFTQVKPVKRAGGRRYYRPADMQLLGGIRKLLHDDGLTIKGVQKILREQGVKHVAALSPPLDSEDVESGMIVDAVPEPDQDRGTVLRFGRDADADTDKKPEVATKPDVTETVAGEPADAPETTETPSETVEDKADSAETEDSAEVEKSKPETVAAMPSFLQKPAESTPKPDEIETEEKTSQTEGATEPDHVEPKDTVADAETVQAPRPTPITTPDDPSDDVSVDPASLSALSKLPQPVSRETADALAAIATRLRAMTRSDENA